MTFAEISGHLSMKTPDNERNIDNDNQKRGKAPDAKLARTQYQYNAHNQSYVEKT